MTQPGNPTYELVDGLAALRSGVEAYFKAYGITARVDIGWTRRYQQDNQGPGGAARVLFIPGDIDPSPGAPKTVDGGTIDRDGTQNAIGLDPQLRALAWHHAVYTCSVWAVSKDKPQDEQMQILATKALLQQTIRAMHNATIVVAQAAPQLVGFGNITEWGRFMWTLPPGQMAFGREATFRFVMTEPLFDAEIGKAYPDPVVTRGTEPPGPPIE